MAWLCWSPSVSVSCVYIHVYFMGCSYGLWPSLLNSLLHFSGAHWVSSHYRDRTPFCSCGTARPDLEHQFVHTHIVIWNVFFELLDTWYLPSFAKSDISYQTASQAWIVHSVAIPICINCYTFRSTKMSRILKVFCLWFWLGFVWFFLLILPGLFSNSFQVCQFHSGYTACTHFRA